MGEMLIKISHKQTIDEGIILIAVNMAACVNRGDGDTEPEGGLLCTFLAYSVHENRLLSLTLVRHVIIYPFIMVIHGYSQHLLGSLLSHHKVL